MSMGLFSVLACQPKRVTDLASEAIFPKPQSVVATNSSFEVTAKTGIRVLGDSPEVTKIGEQLANYLRPATGYAFEVKTDDKMPSKGNILLALDESLTLGDEGYELVIEEKSVVLKAAKPAGLFWGVQTLRQLMPTAVEKGELQPGPWFLATGTITDSPEFEYRGSMLDVSRHFFGVEDVKRYIDFLATYKMNRFHIHLSDDQGWRIEIKSWPNLTVHGGSTQVGGGQGGFYTQEQYADIVRYAQDRYITVVPEIDMPGHTNAALASYGELNPDGKPRDLYTGIEVGFSTFMTDKEITYRFVTDVLTELAALTPGEYIHIGGDESLVTKKPDYIHFINKVQEIVASLGKKVIGWDEIATATLQPGTLAQHWASVENAKLAVAQNARIIMSPAANAYLDMKYDSTSVLGLKWAGYVEVDRAYNWNPVTLVDGLTRENIIGVEAPLWTETVENMEHIEYLVFPRLIGLAEIGWSSPESRDFNEYRLRLGKYGQRLTNQGINFYASPLVEWQTGSAE